MGKGILVGFPCGAIKWFWPSIVVQLLWALPRGWRFNDLWTKAGMPYEEE